MKTRTPGSRPEGAAVIIRETAQDIQRDTQKDMQMAIQKNTQTEECRNTMPDCPMDPGSDALTQKQKGEETRRRKWEKRMEQKRLASMAEEEGNRQRREADEKFMKEAIRQAHRAGNLGDVPIGCVIVREGKIIARGYNRRNADKSVLSHAEITSIRKACKQMGDWRLDDCTMYVTLEPCPMCAGAIVQARIPRVVIGCMNPKAGCAGSVLDMLHETGFNHQVDTEIGILEEECSRLLKDFFRKLRK